MSRQIAVERLLGKLSRGKRAQRFRLIVSAVLNAEKASVAQHTPREHEQAGIQSQAVFAAAFTAGLIGFLIFNFHPAKVFMGDTGSLFLGGAVCALAFALDMPLVLVPLGFVYICETLSDILQVSYFKLTHGKRIFKMAPIHHHFEKCGWSEIKVFAVFSGVSLVLAVITFFCVRSRYGL